MRLTLFTLLMFVGVFTSNAQTTLSTTEAEAYIVKTLNSFTSKFRMGGAPGVYTYKGVKIEGCLVTLKIDMVYEGYNSSHKKVQIIDLKKIETIVQDPSSSGIYINLKTYNAEKTILNNMISTYYGETRPLKEQKVSSLQIPSPEDAKLVEAFNVLRKNCSTK